MSGKELAITILGLAGTFCMPWPGEADGCVQVRERAGVHAAACPARCAGGQPASAPRALDERRASGTAGALRPVGLPAAK